MDVFNSIYSYFPRIFTAPNAVLQTTDHPSNLLESRINAQTTTDMRGLSSLYTSLGFGLKWASIQANEFLNQTIGRRFFTIETQPAFELPAQAGDYQDLFNALNSLAVVLESDPTPTEFHKALATELCENSEGANRLKMLNTMAQLLQTNNQTHANNQTPGVSQHTIDLFADIVAPFKQHPLMTSILQATHYFSVSEQQNAIRNSLSFPMNLTGCIHKALTFHQTKAHQAQRQHPAQLPIEACVDTLATIGIGEHDVELMKESLVQPETIELIRHLLGQPDFNDAFQQVKQHFPASFHPSLEQFVSTYQLDAMARMGRTSLCHINDEQLIHMVRVLTPMGLQQFESTTEKTLLTLGRENPQLAQILQHNVDDKRQQVELALKNASPMLLAIQQPDQNIFEDFLRSQTLLPDYSPKKCISILYHWQKLQENPADLIQLNRLLEEMHIPLELSKTSQTSNLSEPTAPLRHLRAAITSHTLAQEAQKSVLSVFNANDHLDKFSLSTRYACANAFLVALKKTLSPSLNADPTQTLQLSKTHIHALWSITAQLVQATDRSVSIEAANKHGQLSEIIFTEDGACIDADGELLPEGDKKTLELRTRYQDQLTHEFNRKASATRDSLRTIINESWTQLAQALADNPSDETFSALLESALLPKDIQDLLLTLLDELFPEDIRETTLGKALTQTMTQINSRTKQTLVNIISDDQLDGIAQQVTQLVKRLDPYEQMPFFKTFSDTLRTSLGGSKMISDLSTTLTQGYYPQICLEDKRALAIAVLKLGCPEVNDEGTLTDQALTTLIGSMTQSGGPCFQKAMQLFKGDIPTPSIRNALEAMDSDVNPMPDEMVRSIIAEDLIDLTDDAGNRYQIVDSTTYAPEAHWISKAQLRKNEFKRLGSATIAQTHRVYLEKINEFGEPIHSEPECFAIKVRRPGVAHKIAREMNAIQSIPGLEDNVTRTLQELESSIMSETDFSREFQLGRLLQKLYQNKPNNKPSNKSNNNDAQVRVVDMIAHNNRILIQTFIPGKSFEAAWKQKAQHDTLRFITSAEELNNINQEAHKPDFVVLVQNDSAQTLFRASEDGRFNPTGGDQLAQTQTLQTLINTYALQDFAKSHASFQLSDVTEQVIGEAIRDRFNLPLKEGALTLEDQAAFLNRQTNRMQSLISRFAKAAFAGSNQHSLPIFTHPPARTAKAQRPPPGMYVYQSSAVQANTTAKQTPTFEISLITQDKEHVWRSSDATAYQDEHQQLQQLLESHFVKDALITKNPSTRKLPRQVQGQVNNLVRTLFKTQVLFKSESFIDSDRHSGNLLLKAANGQSPEELVVIDTGAGTIMTQFEREGMLQVTIGISTADLTLLEKGLKKLIPDLNDIAIKNPEKLKQDLSKCIHGQFILEEKKDDLYDFLLRHNILNATQDSTSFFYDIMKEPSFTVLKTTFFDFKNPQQALNALNAYIENKNQRTGIHIEQLQGDKAVAFMDYVATLDYGRAIAQSNKKITKPSQWLTDGQNSMLFIRTLRRIANVLHHHGIYAPESLIQVSRGSKFLEDQIKQLNQIKSQVLHRVEDRAAIFAHATLTQTASPTPSTTTLRRQLTPLNLGDAYMNGLTNMRVLGDSLYAIGRRIPMVVRSFIGEHLPG